MIKKLLRDCFVLGFVFAILLVVLFFQSGRSTVEKVLTECAMPVGLFWVALFLLMLHTLRNKQFSTAFGVFLLWGILTACGNGTLGRMLLADLEKDFIEIVPTEETEFDRIVVLGGGSNQAPNGVSQVNGSGDRLVTAARMYHAGKVRMLMCTGTRIKELTREGKDQSAQYAEILMGLGVPKEKIEFLAGQTTSHEMQSLADISGLEKERVGIITSAWHLPRALRLAKSHGLDLIPVPGNFRSPPEFDEPPKIGEIVRDLIPKSDGLNLVTVAMKEHLARLVGR